MRQGFVKVAAATPEAVVADPKENGKRILEKIKEAAGEGAKLIVLPELAISSYTCGDLFFQNTLLEESRKQLVYLAGQTKTVDALIFVGIPLSVGGKIYNAAAALNHGKILGIVPKICIPNYKEFYETRYFATGMKEPVLIDIGTGYEIPMGTNLLLPVMRWNSLS